MSQSFGNQGRKPSRPVGNQNRGNRRPPYQPEEPVEDYDENFDLVEGEDDVNWPALPSRARQPRKPGGSSTKRRSNNEPGIELEPVEPKKRVVALIFDTLAWYIVSMLIGAIPIINHFIPNGIIWTLFLLFRDFFYDGRGIGKNLMGLQVVDAKTGEPCSVKQSVLRNIIILAPFAVLQVIGVILTFVPVPSVTEAIKSTVNVVGMIYLCFVLPLECFRAYNRDDSMRLGDQVAGTAIIEADMDFSNPFSK